MAEDKPQGTTQEAQEQPQGEVKGETLTFEAWSETLTDEQRGLIETHVKGLKSALESERGSRKDFEKQLRDLAKKAEKDSDAQTSLTQLADQVKSENRRATFYEEAHAAGVRNLKLAYTVATTEELFDKQDKVDFDEMKKAYPELFGPAKEPKANAGSGTRDQQPSTFNMDAHIRQKAGVRS